MSGATRAASATSSNSSLPKASRTIGRAGAPPLPSMAMNKLSLKDVDVNGKRVFMRVDFNVPLDDDGRVTDDTRIIETLSTIEYALRHGARLILASPLGGP